VNTRNLSADVDALERRVFAAENFDRLGENLLAGRPQRAGVPIDEVAPVVQSLTVPHLEEVVEMLTQGQLTTRIEDAGGVES
jgi:hypothetical protein